MTYQKIHSLAFVAAMAGGLEACVSPEQADISIGADVTGPNQVHVETITDTSAEIAVDDMAVEQTERFRELVGEFLTNGIDSGDCPVDFNGNPFDPACNGLAEDQNSALNRGMIDTIVPDGDMEALLNLRCDSGDHIQVFTLGKPATRGQNEVRYGFLVFLERGTAPVDPSTVDIDTIDVGLGIPFPNFSSYAADFGSEPGSPAGSIRRAWTKDGRTGYTTMVLDHGGPGPFGTYSDPMISVNDRTYEGMEGLDYHASDTPFVGQFQAIPHDPAGDINEMFDCQGRD